MYGRPLADATVNKLYKQMEHAWASMTENVVDIKRDEDAVAIAKVARGTGPRSGAGKRPRIRPQKILRPGSNLSGQLPSDFARLKSQQTIAPCVAKRSR